MLSPNQVWGPRPVQPPQGGPRGLRPAAPAAPLSPLYGLVCGLACPRGAPLLRPLLRLCKANVRARSASWGRPRPRPMQPARAHSTATQNRYFVSFGAALKSARPKRQALWVQNSCFAHKYVKPPTAGPHWAGAGGCLAPSQSGLLHPTSFRGASLAAFAHAGNRPRSAPSQIPPAAPTPSLAAFAHAGKRPRSGWGSARCGSQGPGLFACFMVLWQACKPGPQIGPASFFQHLLLNFQFSLDSVAITCYYIRGPTDDPSFRRMAA